MRFWRDCPVWTTGQLPRLIEAYQQGNTSVVFVVSAIGSHHAMAFLREQLKKKSGDLTYTVEAYARLLFPRSWHSTADPAMRHSGGRWKNCSVVSRRMRGFRQEHLRGVS